MANKSEVTLAALDGRLLDGLDFCRLVYDLFDQVKRAPGGTSKLRLRSTATEKRLAEEVIPIAQYIQARYRPGRRIKVRWFAGSQSFDAILWSSGELVTRRFLPKRQVIEVTTAVHPNEYLVRQLIDQGGVSFGVKRISRDSKTGRIVSEAYAYDCLELARDLADQIVACVKRKTQKKYPPTAALIVNCVPNTLIHDSEWNEAVERVRSAQAQFGFAEVFLLELMGFHSATLYGKTGVQRRRRSK